MRIFLLFYAVLNLGNLSFAQTNTYSSRADSDPQALALLEKLRTQVQKERLQVDFELSMMQPESEPFVQTGTFVMQGKMYRITTEAYEIWCDGTSRWVYETSGKEVQLYNAGGDEDLSPVALFLEMTGEQYVAVVTEPALSGTSTEIIELKPIDRYSEFSKLRLTLHRDGKPVKLEIFEKSSARTILHVRRMTIPDVLPESSFRFNVSLYPGVHVEDLRID